MNSYALAATARDCAGGKALGGIVMLLEAAVLAAAVSLQPADLVGSYYQGEGTGVNMTLVLRADGSFTFDWEGCIGTYDQKSGTWTFVEDLVYLDVVKAAPDGSPDSLAPVFRPVFWGSRTYLVPADEMQDFCNEVNGGVEPRSDAYGGTYLREDDWEKSVSGVSPSGESIASCLLEHPVRAEILSRTGPSSVRIGAGSTSGLRPGMVLYDQSVLDIVSFRVIAVSDAGSDLETEFGKPAPATGSLSTLLWDETLRSEHSDAGSNAADER